VVGIAGNRVDANTMGARRGDVTQCDVCFGSLQDSLAPDAS
jgi:hypothetical protein